MVKRRELTVNTGWALIQEHPRDKADIFPLLVGLFEDRRILEVDVQEEGVWGEDEVWG